MTPPSTDWNRGQEFPMRRLRLWPKLAPCKENSHRKRWLVAFPAPRAGSPGQARPLPSSRRAFSASAAARLRSSSGRASSARLRSFSSRACAISSRLSHTRLLGRSSSSISFCIRLLGRSSSKALRSAGGWASSAAPQLLALRPTDRLSHTKYLEQRLESMFVVGPEIDVLDTAQL